jgi:2-methylisocitrate lyase-like PEP mutase family enzyme
VQSFCATGKRRTKTASTRRTCREARREMPFAPTDLLPHQRLAGFSALATTSSGFAASLGRVDQSVTREEALRHAAEIAAVTDLPVSADLENGFGDDPADVAETIRGALEAGLAGGSVEDYSEAQGAVYDLGHAVARIAAAAEVAHAGDAHLVLTARAENYLYGRPDLDDTLARLTAFRDAGADVVYAPGMTSAEEIRTVVEAVGIPVNVLVRGGVPSTAELARLGVARISVGGHFAFTAMAALIEAADEFRGPGTYSFVERSAQGAQAVRRAFS